MYLVVFRNRKRAGMDAEAYAVDAEHMLELAQAQAGFLAFKSYVAEDGEVVAISEWADAASARGWGRHMEHAEVQGRGRADYYADYTLFGCDEPLVHSFRKDGL